MVIAYAIESQAENNIAPIWQQLLWSVHSSHPEE